MLGLFGKESRCGFPLGSSGLLSFKLLHRCHAPKLLGAFLPTLAKVPMQQPKGLVVFQIRIEPEDAAKNLLGEIGEFKSIVSLRCYPGGENPEGQ